MNNKMHIVILIMFVCLSVICCGCIRKSIDDNFKEAYARGLEKRWELIESEKGLVFGEENYRSYIQAELREISKYEKKDFKDDRIAKFCRDYVKLLNQESESIKSFSSDSWKAEWNQLQDERSRLIYINDEILKPRFSNDENQEKYRELLLQGKILPEVQNMMDDINFNRKDGDSFYVKVKNTTGETLGYLGINVKLIGENNKPIGTTGTGIKNWKNGEEHEFTINTSEEVDDIEIDSITCIATAVY